MRTEPAIPLTRTTRAAMNTHSYLRSTHQTVTDLAHYCGVHMSTAWDWLYRNKRPHPTRRALIARFTKGAAAVAQWNEIVPVPAHRRRALRPTGSD
jgi:hypothetical protein